MPWKPRTHAQTSRTTQRPKDNRLSASQRGYDRTWRKFRAWFLCQHPLCCDIFSTHAKEKQVVAATEVDHIIPLQERPDLRLIESNCRSLCKSCHSRRTAMEMKR